MLLLGKGQSQSFAKFCSVMTKTLGNQVSLGVLPIQWLAKMVQPDFCAQPAS